MFIDIHILQTVPPSNVNRDDTGSPKTATFGGTRRARVSSQSWKRATRERFNLTLDKSEIGFRTRRLAELLGDRLRERIAGLDDDEAYALASSTFKAAGIVMKPPKVAKNAPPKPDESGYLVFLSAGQLESLAELAASSHAAGAEPDKKTAKALANVDHSVDVALFGRMVADDTQLNVDAAVQVAHAISVQAVEQEFDYFTAVDDFQESQQESGAGMIGTIEFNSSTLYRYATINVGGLAENLGDAEATAKAASAFTESFAMSMPSGKRNTFANNTVPDAVLICVRLDQPISLVGAFEDAILPTVDEGAVSLASKCLVTRLGEIGTAYGAPVALFYTAIGSAGKEFESLGENLPVSEVVARVEATVTNKLSSRA